MSSISEHTEFSKKRQRFHSDSEFPIPRSSVWHWDSKFPSLSSTDTSDTENLLSQSHPDGFGIAQTIRMALGQQIRYPVDIRCCTKGVRLAMGHPDVHETTACHPKAIRTPPRDIRQSSRGYPDGFKSQQGPS